MATDPIVARERYVALMRADEKNNYDGGSTLIDSTTIQSCNLIDDEVLLAVPRGFIPEVIVESAKTILQNRKLLRSVSFLFLFFFKNVICDMIKSVNKYKTLYYQVFLRISYLFFH